MPASYRIRQIGTYVQAANLVKKSIKTVGHYKDKLVIK